MGIPPEAVETIVEETLAEEILQRFLPQINGFEQAKVLAVTALAGDASAREYSRVNLQGAPVASLIFMKLAQGVGPVSSAGESFNQDDTFLLVSQFLNAQELCVPKIFWDGRAEGFLLVEDAGDIALASVLLGWHTSDHHALLQKLPDNTIEQLFSKAAAWIQQLQAVPMDNTFVGFQRSIDAEHYMLESQRFIDHYLKPNGFDAQMVPPVQAMLQDICDRVAKHKRTLIHRDFIAWNIHVAADGDIRVIDFQDMTLGSYVYDIVSLLHDRDVDFILGQNLCEKLARAFKASMAFGDDFYQDYALVVLQRYLRLAGQFLLLTQKTGKPVYKGWVPGCLKRVGQFLPLFPEYAEARKLLTQAIPVMALGAASPWFQQKG